MHRSPVPPQVEAELARLAHRWRTLPVGQAVAALPIMYAACREIADQPVPELGERSVLDQLTVLVYDACTRGDDPGDLSGLLRRLLARL